VFFFALLVWFIVVVGTNIVNHYRFIPLIGTTSSGISNQLRDIYPGTAGMLLHVHTGKIEIMSFVVISLTAPHSISSHRSSYEADLSVSVVSFISTSMG
jgi:hypothetical protein